MKSIVYMLQNGLQIIPYYFVFPELSQQQPCLLEVKNSDWFDLDTPS